MVVQTQTSCNIKKQKCGVLTAFKAISFLCVSSFYDAQKGENHKSEAQLKEFELLGFFVIG